MTAKWKGPIGPVTIKQSHGDTWAFGDLADALRFVQRHGLIIKENLPDPLRRPDGLHYFTDLHAACLRDECGLVIPLWRIADELALIGPRPRRSYGRWNKGTSRYDPERDFRKRAMPGIGRRHWGRFYRQVKTQAERREHLGLEADLHDLEDFPVQVKIRSRRRKIPSAWDDIMHADRGHSWKHHRKTQYKA